MCNPGADTTAPLLVVSAGAPLVRMRNLHVAGTLLVDGGLLELDNCTMAPPTATPSGRRAAERGLQSASNPAAIEVRTGVSAGNVVEGGTPTHR